VEKSSRKKKEGGEGGGNVGIMKTGGDWITNDGGGEIKENIIGARRAGEAPH